MVRLTRSGMERIQQYPMTKRRNAAARMLGRYPTDNEMEWIDMGWIPGSLL